MGNASSKIDKDGFLHTPPELSLDGLGGLNRPAIKRGDSLNKKLEWLQVTKSSDHHEI